MMWARSPVPSMASPATRQRDAGWRCSLPAEGVCDARHCSHGLCILLGCTSGCGFQEHTCLKSGLPVSSSRYLHVGMQLLPDAHCWHIKSQRQGTWNSGRGLGVLL